MQKKRYNGEQIRLLSGAEPKERLQIFRGLHPRRRSFLLPELPPEIRKELLNSLNNDELIHLLDFLDPDTATDLIQEIKGAKRRDKIVDSLKTAIREKVEFLLRFQPNTAAGIMDLNYIQIEPTDTFEDISAQMSAHEKRTGKIPTLLVVEDGELTGELPTHLLALHGKKTRARKFIKPLPSLYYHEDKNKVIDLFRHNPHNKVVVLDSDESILGVIFSDDIINLLSRQSAKALYDYAGVRQEEDVFDPPKMKVRSRYKWLILNLGTAFLAASVISLFQDTIDKLVLLAVYMPIVAGMGGNAATQTLAVMVRGIALKEIDLKNCRTAITNEVKSGLINGVINGIIVALVAILWNQNPVLGFVIGVSMVVNLVIAGFFGALIPLVIKRLGKDPATAAAIFITTATDVFGFFTFLGLASLLLV